MFARRITNLTQYTATQPRDLNQDVDAQHRNQYIYITWPKSGIPFLLDNTAPLHHQSQSRQRTVSQIDFTTMVSRPAAEDTMPISESGSSGVHANDQPLRDPQADLEAGGSDQEKAESASTASSPPPPAYFSSISSHNEPCAKTQLVAQKPIATSHNVVVEDVERGHSREELESAERQRQTIRAIVETAVVEQLAKKKKEEDDDQNCGCILTAIVCLLIIGIIWLVNKLSS
jgi:hypothetical protein